MQLRESAARNHTSDFAESPIRPDAVGVFAEPQPHPSAGAFDGACESAIVNEFAADGRDAADFFEHSVADQHAPAGRSRGCAARAPYPGGRIEQEKEEDEGRD